VKRTKKHTNIFNLPYEYMEFCIVRIGKHILRSKRKYEEIYAIPRGGLILGVYLSHYLNIPMVTNVKGPNTLIVDDICDTGKTLQKYKQDKVVLIGKPKGIKKVKKIFTAYMVLDDTWVVFPWEA